jgi:hypothetical protein
MCYLQKIIDMGTGTELLSTLQASCRLWQEGIEERCQTEKTLREFKRELESARNAYTGTTDFQFRYLNSEREIQTPTAELAAERLLVQPILKVCLDFIFMMQMRVPVISESVMPTMPTSEPEKAQNGTVHNAFLDTRALLRQLVETVTG